MEGIASFVGTVICMSMLAMITEFSIPSGALKSSVSVSVGLVYLSAVLDQILGIIARMGV